MRSSEDHFYTFTSCALKVSRCRLPSMLSYIKTETQYEQGLKGGQESMPTAHNTKSRSWHLSVGIRIWCNQKLIPDAVSVVMNVGFIWQKCTSEKVTKHSQFYSGSGINITYNKSIVRFKDRQNVYSNLTNTLIP